jgi:hypothetical protein
VAGSARRCGLAAQSLAQALAAPVRQHTRGDGRHAPSVDARARACVCAKVCQSNLLRLWPRRWRPSRHASVVGLSGSGSQACDRTSGVSARRHRYKRPHVGTHRPKRRAASSRTGA